MVDDVRLSQFADAGSFGGSNNGAGDVLYRIHKELTEMSILGLSTPITDGITHSRILALSDLRNCEGLASGYG